MNKIVNKNLKFHNTRLASYATFYICVDFCFMTSKHTYLKSNKLTGIILSSPNCFPVK